MAYLPRLSARYSFYVGSGVQQTRHIRFSAEKILADLRIAEDIGGWGYWNNSACRLSMPEGASLLTTFVEKRPYGYI